MSASQQPEPQDRRRRRMDRVDAMPPDIRACVHEYGLSIVDAMLDAGVKKARHIRHIVAMVRRESYQSSRDGAVYPPAPPKEPARDA